VNKSQYINQIKEAIQVMDHSDGDMIGIGSLLSQNQANLTQENLDHPQTELPILNKY
jgi:hypothetical protein